jgi:hypothetical protein
MMGRELPTSPRERKATALALVAGAAIGIALFGGYVPGIHPTFTSPAVITFDGKLYYWKEIGVPLPVVLSNSSPSEKIAVHNATFEVYTIGWLSGGGSYLAGNATLDSGVTYPFSVGGSVASPDHTTQYVSPDGEIAVVWNATFAAYLMVAA